MNAFVRSMCTLYVNMFIVRIEREIAINTYSRTKYVLKYIELMMQSQFMKLDSTFIYLIYSSGLNIYI